MSEIDPLKITKRYFSITKKIAQLANSAANVGFERFNSESNTLFQDLYACNSTRFQTNLGFYFLRSQPPHWRSAQATWEYERVHAYEIPLDEQAIPERLSHVALERNRVYPLCGMVMLRGAELKVGYLYGYDSLRVAHAFVAPHDIVPLFSNSLVAVSLTHEQ